MIARTLAITSLDLPELEPYRTLKRPIEHKRQGIFVAEGEKVVRRLLESPLIPLSILLTPQWLEVQRDVLVSRPEQIDVFTGEKQLLETIVGHNLHLGIMAVAKIPPPSTLDSVLSASAKPWFFAAVDGVTNAENLGVMVRNCVAAGVQALFVGETCADPYLRRAVRNSMGTIFKLPIVYSEDLAGTLQALAALHRVSIAAAHCDSAQTPIDHVDFRRDCCVVFGSEGEGISDRVAAACTSFFTIPMRDGVDSFNVASATGIVVYEVMRQRRKETELQQRET
jgi:tRNA G18 (ribose-2'-O)-methylase SpoU